MRNVAQVVIFNVGADNKLLAMPTRAFLRHAVRWWYASLTGVQQEGKGWVWKACLHITLLRFREAVTRKCASIRRHYIHRENTRLTEVVPEEERLRYACVATIQKHGEYTISPALKAAIRDAQ